MIKKHLGWIFVIGFIGVAVAIIWESYSVSYAEHSDTSHQKAPNFELANLDGDKVRLNDSTGKIRIVDFWATWCPPCRAEIPHFNALTSKYPDLVILGIALDREGPSVLKPFAKEYNIQYPLLIGNSETVQAFGDIQSIPTTFVIDQAGYIIKKYVGYRPQSVFEADIKQLSEAGI